MSAKKKKKAKTTTKKKRTTKKKAKRTAKAKTSSVKRAGRQTRSEYDSWTGAASTSNREIFDTETKERLNLDDYPGIATYLPPNSADAFAHFFVARVATVSKKPGGKEVLKLFGNRSWNDDLSRQLEAMDFTKVHGDIDHLISDVKLEIDTDTGWKADSFVELFRKLVPGKLTAKVIFTNPTDQYRPRISAFWCW